MPFANLRAMSSLVSNAASSSLAVPPPPSQRPGALDVALSDLRYRPHVNRNAAVAVGIGASIAVTALAALAKGSPRRTLAMSTAVGMATGLVLVRSQLARWFTDQPAYEIESRGALEIRRYHGAVMARTFVASSQTARGLKRPIEEGFHRLFGYIAGKNASREKMAMLAPVTVQPTLGGSFVSFFLPASRTKSSFPKPNDSRIEIVWSGPKRVAALRYGGNFANTNRKTVGEQIAQALMARKIAPAGDPIFAGYDAPYVLEVLRRNEAWVEI